jgi:hypothetical protein
MPHRPSHDPAKHISSAFVGGKNSIADQKGRRSAVVSDYSNGDIGSRILSIGNMADHFDLSKDGLEEIRFIVTFDPLKNGRNPFQAHPGIDAGFGQRLNFTFRITIELHEDEVPEF